MTAGYLNITTNYLPKQDWLKVSLSVILMILLALVFIEAFRKWFELLQVKELVKDKYGELVLENVEE
jgi:carbon starvation protein